MTENDDEVDCHKTLLGRTMLYTTMLNGVKAF